MTDPNDQGTPPPDAHLQAALRHAPDRDLQPPPALSARILDEARRAIAPPPWPHRFWTWLARPVPAGAFSSVLLAGFIGLMWRNGPPPEAVAPSAVAPAPQTTSVPSVPPASADPSLTAKQAVPTELLQKTQPTAAAPTQGAAAPDVVAAAPSMAESRSASASMPSALARQRASTASESPSLQGSAAAMGAPSVPPDPLAAMVEAWRAGGPESAAPRHWWEALRDQTQGRWRDAEPVRGADSLLLAGPAGEPLGRLRWEPAAVRWQAAGDDRGWRAELSAGEIERLRRTMPR